MSEHPRPAAFGVLIDRDAEIPIGVQLAWAVRARINDGGLEAGQRLPGVRELAHAAGLNVNTVRAVYQRLDQEGLVDTRQGTGTFVARTRREPSQAAAIAAHAARESQESCVDPREVAAALYVSAQLPARPSDGEARWRRVLLDEIGALEREIGELESKHPGVASPPNRVITGAGPTLLSAEQLELVRTQLVRRLSVVQDAIGKLLQPGSGAVPDADEPEALKARAVAKRKRDPAPRPATSPAAAGA